MTIPSKPVVQVDVFSDISCPWCWVGKRRFDAALEQLGGEAEFAVRYHAYVIDHKTAKGGEEYLAYNVRRWGGDGWCADLRRSGARDGAAFADWRWWPNSVGGHQLILYAQERGLGRQMKDLLLRKTYEEGANVSSVDELVAAAEQLGLPAAEVRQHLEADAGRDAVLADDAYGKRELGISGVPFFIFSAGGQQEGGGQEGLALSGAQPVAAFVGAARKVLASQQQAQS